MKARQSIAAFSMVEVLIAACISSVVGLVIYGVASEALVAFSRNISINRSYGETRRTLDRIASAMDSAGHTPVLLDANGVDATSKTGSWAGIRFWRTGSKPRYTIPQLTTTTTALKSLTLPVMSLNAITINLAMPSDIPTHSNAVTTTVNSPPPLVGDLITVPVLGFQAPLQGVAASGSTAVLTFAGTITSFTTPTLNALPTNFPPGVSSIECVDWTPVAFIAVGTQLRYFPRFIKGSTSITNPANYKVVTNLLSNPPVSLTSALLPFSLGPASATMNSTINVDLYAEAPDYNKRNLGSANTYTCLQTALAPRNPPAAVQNP